MSQQDDGVLNQSISFPETENKILKFWNEKKIFERTLDSSKPAFRFYDGPPFASGLPHYGHLLASTLKDIVPRYWTMKGFFVDRRWGWDCHGLPIEQEIDKKFEFKSTEDIEKFGIAKYNQECRQIVLRFTHEWERTIRRMGRWVDFSRQYRTMDLEFMESVWWVMGELWNQGLIYRGYKVMPFSTALGTPLSNFEASQNYQDVQDPAITVTFPLKEDPSVSFLAWTTTPWTLPSNLALAVGKEISYVMVSTEDGKKFILAEALLEATFKKAPTQVLKTFTGADLIGKAYEPLFHFYPKQNAKAFQVIASDHVTTDAGTGIVHMAPAFGEEDFWACKPHGLEPWCPVDHHGKFTNEVPPYAGQYIKEADKKIIQDLKSAGRLYKQDTLQHSYPFCPRTDTPLIYKAVSSWFVSVEKIKNRLMKNNREQTHWVPEHLREGRFGKWLQNARDWAISRNRYWGNPLPFFEAFEEPEATREVFCVASRKELEELTGKKFDDLHREFLDDLIIVKNGKKFKRVPEVLDCWFESGSMPYAQIHYPFENKDVFNRVFPADFIAEGLDQTRGWFYTLTVLGTALFDRAPFKNVVVNGLILAEDGKKMSKRLKNYPDPDHVLETYGADALRLYLIDSPVIRGEELRFSEKGLREIIRRVLLKWWNSYTFYESYASIDGFRGDSTKSPPRSGNLLDRWIISRLQSLLLKIEDEMKVYHLYNVVPALLLFIEDLTNTYIRLNRPRFWAEGFEADKKSAFETLHYVLTQLSKLMAPFTPFLSEHTYQLLTKAESVHLESYPMATREAIDRPLEEGVELLEEVLLQGRNSRDGKKIKVKVPLQRLDIVNRDPQKLSRLKPLENYIKEELNVREIHYRHDEEAVVSLSAKVDGAKVGKRAGAKMKELSAQVQGMSFSEIMSLERGEALAREFAIPISSEDVKILREPKLTHEHQVVAASSKLATVLYTEVKPDQVLEGLSREVVNRIQKSRKDSKLQLSDRIRLRLQASNHLVAAIEAHRKYIEDQTLAIEIQINAGTPFPALHTHDVEGQELIVSLERV